MSAKNRRLLFFILVILVGMGAGLAFGWLIVPPKPATSAELNRLRSDFKTDLVLMVAEQYQAKKDVFHALDQLVKIDTTDPLTLLVNAVNYGSGIGYPQADLDTMKALLSDITLQVLEEWTNRGLND